MPGRRTTVEPSAVAGGSSVVGTDHPGVPLIGLAHGSRHPSGAVAIEQLLAAVTAQSGVPTVAAYLDLAEPDLEAACRHLAERGHRSAIVVPLLFTEAFHATVDVPQAIAAATTATGMTLHRAEILGTSDDIAELVGAVLWVADVPPTLDVLLYAVGSSSATANAAVADLVDRVAARRGTRVRTAFATTAPKIDVVLPELTAPVALVPLFLSDGLLLDPLRRLAAEHGWPSTEPFGAAAADVVLARYHAALRPSETPGATETAVGVGGGR